MAENIFLAWLYLQLYSGEQSIRARSKTWWGQEAKLPMPSPKQKANPDFKKIKTIFSENNLLGLKMYILIAMYAKNK